MSQKSSRRALASLGTLGLVGGGALMGVGVMQAGPAAADTMSTTISYECSVPDFGLEFNDAWQVTVSTDLPAQVEPGASVPAPTITSKVVAGNDAADLLRNTGNESITAGTATAD